MQATARSGKKLQLRRGPQYERLLEQGHIQKIAAGQFPYNRAEVELGINKGTLHKYVTTWKYDTEMAAVPTPDQEPELFTDLVKFTETYFPELDIPEFHKEWADAIHKNAREAGQLLLLAPQRHGKAIDAETEMLTRDRGWVAARDVEVGDHLVASDGGWTRVEGVFPQGVTDAWRVSFGDKTSLVTCGRHRWATQTRYAAAGVNRCRKDSWQVKTTDELRSSGEWSYRRIPMVAPLKGRDETLPLDPYLLGCWLGDGTTNAAAITSADPEIIHAFEERFTATTREPRGRAVTVHFVGESYGDGLLRVLKGLNVLGNKHVPEAYLHATAEDRLALLQGLLDTDGTINSTSRQVSFCTTLPAIADAVKWLVSSLGGTWGEYVKSPWHYNADRERVPGKKAHILGIVLPEGMPAFRLQRKLDKVPPHQPTRDPRRIIRSIERVADRETVCFSVDAPDHLFCAGRDLIVTHNTEMLIRYCVMRICANPDISILWVSKTASLAEKMVGHVRSILEHHPMLADSVLGQGRSFKPARTSGLSWTDKEFTVANRTRVRKTPTMVAIGTGGTIVGLDADEMILDDPQDHIRCQSPTQREKDKEWFFTDFASRKMEQTALSFIMSRQHMEDLPGLVMRDHAEDWEILTYQAHDSACVLPEKIKGKGPTGMNVNPAHDEGGCVLWPKFRSYKWLMGRRRQDEAHFERNYQNNPRSDATTYITADDIDNLRDRTRRVGDIPSGCRLIAGIDPAEAKPVAAVLWGFDGLHRHIIDCVEAPASVVGLRWILTNWPAMYGVRTFAFEKNIAQSWVLDEEVKRLIASQRLHVKQFYTSRVNKNSNAIGPISMFQRMRTSPPEITLPGAPGEGQERIDRLVRSWLTFDPDYASHKHADDDLTMASWFPQITMDEWNRPTKHEIQLDYDAIGSL